MFEASPDDKKKEKKENGDIFYFECDCSKRLHPNTWLYSLSEFLKGLLGAELIFRLSSWMLFASLMREGCRVKLRLVPGDEKSFLAQLSRDALDSRTFVLLDEHSEVDLSRSKTGH